MRKLTSTNIYKKNFPNKQKQDIFIDYKKLQEKMNKLKNIFSSKKQTPFESPFQSKSPTAYKR